jgi:Fe-S cluster biogenesis protein NfuA
LTIKNNSEKTLKSRFSPVKSVKNNETPVNKTPKDQKINRIVEEVFIRLNG